MRQAAGHVLLLRRLAAAHQTLVAEGVAASAEACCSARQQLSGTAAAARQAGGTSSGRAFSAYASSGRGFRRINPGGAAGSSGGAGGSLAAAGEAAGSSSSGSNAAGPSIVEMSREVPGGAKPLFRWEKWYWGIGVGGVAYFLYSRLKTPDKTPEEIAEVERKTEELRQARKDHLRSVLMAQNFLEGESDPLEGLTPAQIVMFMEKYAIDPSDPLEGLSPEEIDVYMQQQEAKRLGQGQGPEQPEQAAAAS